MRIVTVDLDRSSVNYEKAADDIVARFLGGRGTNVKLLFDLTQPGVDPLSGACPIIFGTGPLTGTPFPMGGRFEATTKSPLTGTIFTSSCGGRLGVHLKKNGIDCLVVKGVSSVPSYLFIEHGDLQVLDARQIWGKEKGFVKRVLRERHGTDLSIALIGTAGEHMVPFSNIENDGRYLGRGGLGAVLGSKNLKAIAVKGKGKIEAPDKEQFAFVAYECRKWLSANPITAKGLPEFGTAVLLNYMREMGLLYTKNFRFEAPYESSCLSGEAVAETILKKRRACPFCPVACGRITQQGDGPEYESLWALGVNLSIYDVEKVARLNGLCNELGLDTISTGSVIGMAAELS